MTTMLDYLKGKLEEAKDEVITWESRIKGEEKRTQLFEVRVVVETKGYREEDWRRSILCENFLTLPERGTMIANLRWLKDVGLQEAKK